MEKSQNAHVDFQQCTPPNLTCNMLVRHWCLIVLLPSAAHSKKICINRSNQNWSTILCSYNTQLLVLLLAARDPIKIGWWILYVAQHGQPMLLESAVKDFVAQSILAITPTTPWKHFSWHICLARGVCWSIYDKTYFSLLLFLQRLLKPNQSLFRLWGWARCVHSL